MYKIDDKELNDVIIINKDEEIRLEPGIYYTPDKFEQEYNYNHSTLRVQLAKYKLGIRLKSQVLLKESDVLFLASKIGKKGPGSSKKGKK
ncbi:MAG: hypothetical protein JXR63_00155 [Spirochaetales bacterium]|nr:hypothetical protein [Spirochaetales bacterium]